MKEVAFERTRVVIYGGFNTVGGNCVVVRSPSVSVMLDQGVNFQQLRRFYGITVQPDSVEELREMGVLPPREAYEGVDEVVITHLHLDHVGSLNVPGDTPVYVPSVEVAEALSHSWWFGWKQQLLPPTLSFRGLRGVEDSRRVRAVRVSRSAFPRTPLRR
uniref:MBL fold metallo-hydrolase n=1 Tax=Thermosphaera aggregans TaxID=54254 RepID=A0A7C2BLL1_9CREN